MSAGAALRLDDVHGYYGKSHILQGVSLEVRPSEIVCLLGRNGAGKTTTLRSISGLLPPRSGRVTFGENEIAGWAPHRVARAGLCLVPEDRGIFGLLTVEENLRIAVRKGAPWSIRDIYRIFPRLEERRRNGGAQLSGGEQQMLSIARALLNGPKLLMLDEPVEGSPLSSLRKSLRRSASSATLGCQSCSSSRTSQSAPASQTGTTSLRLGRIVYHATAADFARDEAARDRFLGVKAH
ncbi:ABC transporter ATP-binding protein [Methylobacterium sp. P31]